LRWRGAFSAASYLIHVTMSAPLSVVVVRWQDRQSTARNDRVIGPLRRQIYGHGATTSDGFARRCGDTSTLYSWVLRRGVATPVFYIS
jgi:hypothetical protein